MPPSPFQATGDEAATALLEANSITVHVARDVVALELGPNEHDLQPSLLGRGADIALACEDAIRNSDPDGDLLDALGQALFLAALLARDPLWTYRAVAELLAETDVEQAAEHEEDEEPEDVAIEGDPDPEDEEPDNVYPLPVG